MPREHIASLPAALKHHRARLGLSQSALAELAGVTRLHVARLEAGTTGASLWLARRLADALGVSLDTLSPTGSAGEVAPKKSPERA
jgi:transcriptional regulator with XRE-family HTH domain